MIYEIVTAPKSDVPTEEAVRAALAEHKAGFTVENIDSDGNDWIVRLAADDDKPDFLKKKDDDADSSDSADDSSDDSDSSDSDSSDDADSDSDSEGDDKGDKKKCDPVAEVKAVIDQLTGLFQDLGGKVQDLQAAHDDKAQKLKDISDTVGPDGADGEGGPEGVAGMPPAAGLPEDIGPTPGKPAGPPRPPMPAKGLDKRRPGVPSGLPAFTNYQVATHPGVDETGKKISLTAAAVAMENDPDFTEYEVVGMTENADGTFSAKLKLREES